MGDGNRKRAVWLFMLKGKILSYNSAMSSSVNRELPLPIIDVIKEATTPSSDGSAPLTLEESVQIALDTIDLFSNQQPFDAEIYKLLVQQALLRCESNLQDHSHRNDREFAIIVSIAAYFGEEVITNKKHPSQVLNYHFNFHDILANIKSTHTD